MARSVILVAGLLLTFGVGGAADAQEGEQYQRSVAAPNTGVVSSQSQDRHEASERSENTGEIPASSESSASSAVSGSSSSSTAAGAVPFKYVGNSFSCIFHRPSCPFGQCISAHHLRFFARRFNAIDAGYRPCGYCLPKTWTTVHAVLLGKQSQRAPPAVTP